MNTPTIYFIVFIIGLGGVLIGITGFWNGYHNVDLAMNMNIWSDYIRGIYDTGSDGVERTPIELYMLGMEQVKTNSMIIMLSGIILGMGMIGLITRGKDE